MSEFGVVKFCIGRLYFKSMARGKKFCLDNISGSINFLLCHGVFIVKDDELFLLFIFCLSLKVPIKC